jgi:hypothetical protein
MREQSWKEKKRRVFQSDLIGSMQLFCRVMLTRHKGKKRMQEMVPFSFVWVFVQTRESKIHNKTEGMKGEV